MSPSGQERVFRKGYAGELLRIAESDLDTVEYLLEGLTQGRIRGESYFFAVQQVLEKALKAVLVHRGIPVPMVNDLGVLLAKVPRECEPPFGYEIGALTEFAAARRYEESSLEWGLEEAQEALGLGKSAVDWARGVIAPA
jgi:HEPN domain-containing protein